MTNNNFQSSGIDENSLPTLKSSGKKILSNFHILKRKSTEKDLDVARKANIKKYNFSKWKSSIRAIWWIKIPVSSERKEQEQHSGLPEENSSWNTRYSTLKSPEEV